MQGNAVIGFIIFQSPVDWANPTVLGEKTIVYVEQNPKAFYMALTEYLIEVYRYAKVSFAYREFIESVGRTYLDPLLPGPIAEG